MKILGISAFRHDAAACLVIDGRIVAAAQEERFTRKKHDRSFPVQAIASCLAQAGCTLAGLDHVAFYDQRVPAHTICDGLAACGEPAIDWQARLISLPCHLSHAASAYFPSPFDAAAVLTIDGNTGAGSTTTSLALGEGNTLQMLQEMPAPHSLGLLYSAVTRHLGFKIDSGEFKVMGLAPYGTPQYAASIRQHLIELGSDGAFALNLCCPDFIETETGADNRVCPSTSSLTALFGPARMPEAPLTRRDVDLAASVQQVTELAMLGLARRIALLTGQPNLCLAGGVALNCVANGKLLRSGLFERLWIQPASGDAGGAIGAALAALHLVLKRKRRVLNGIEDADGTDGMQGCYLGPQYTQADIVQRLTTAGAVFTTPGDDALVDAAARALADGKAMGWHQGRMEFGPRALGNRSILADPRVPDMQARLNLKIKYRESFRPFAPSVLREDLGDWFDLAGDSPAMMLVADVVALQRTALPAVTHVDHSARIQTVHAATNARFHALISRFKQLTGCPVLVNTSFNVRGEPVVETPEDAFRCFMGTGLDVLVVGNCLLYKELQRPLPPGNHADRFAPD